MSWDEFCEKINKFFRGMLKRLEFQSNEKEITFTIADQKYKYTIEEYEQLKQKALGYDFTPFALYSPSSYEIMIDAADFESGRYIVMDLKKTDLVIEDSDKDLIYSLQNISDELVWHFFNSSDENCKFFSPVVGFFLERRFENFLEKSLIGLIKVAMQRPYALVVSSKSTNAQESYQIYAKSFLFNFAYNFDIVLKPLTTYEELFPQRRTLRERKKNQISEIVAPQLSYKQELVEQYYMALTSADPFVKFIGFYHIMENFYEEVYNEDMFRSVQRMIQHPGFSSKRMKDVSEIVTLIQKKTRQNKEEFQGSELEALELTLRKFISIPELVKALDHYDKELVDYYKKTELSFSKGDALDLRDTMHDKLYKKLAARIYKTRNALVHSKSNENRLNERCVYKPFLNSKELMREIPLMRFIAEAIIIHSAKEL